jgi:hypothetical protein
MKNININIQIEERETITTIKVIEMQLTLNGEIKFISKI